MLNYHLGPIKDGNIYLISDAMKEARVEARELKISFCCWWGFFKFPKKGMKRSTLSSTENMRPLCYLRGILFSYRRMNEFNEWMNHRRWSLCEMESCEWSMFFGNLLTHPMLGKISSLNRFDLTVLCSSHRHSSPHLSVNNCFHAWSPFDNQISLIILHNKQPISNNRRQWELKTQGLGQLFFHNNFKQHQFYESMLSGRDLLWIYGVLKMTRNQFHQKATWKFVCLDAWLNISGTRIQRFHWTFHS